MKSSNSVIHSIPYYYYYYYYYYYKYPDSRGHSFNSSLSSRKTARARRKEGKMSTMPASAW